MFHINEAKRALGTEVAVSGKMQTAIDLWSDMLQGLAPWLDGNTQSLGLPASIAGEFARLIFVEFESGISGSARADWLDAEYRRMQRQLRDGVELACAVGGCAFKPYFDGEHLAVDCVPAWRFFPTGFNSIGEITGAVFTERVTKGDTYYTRMEQHSMTDAGYEIRNLAFRSFTESELGSPCSLESVDEWAVLEPELTIRYKDGSRPEGPLFAYFRMPMANTVDTESPLGVSAYSRAVDLIKEADRQYSRILWEFEGSELAIDASAGALMVRDENGKRKAVMPERKKRLFRELAIDQGSGGDLYKVFSPEIRDTSLFNGLDKLLKRIEFSCALAYGTLSDPQNVEKTAEEIRAGKQRSYAAVCGMQSALQKALEQLIWCMDFYASLYKLAPAGKYETSFTWGDGILEDSAQEFARRKQLVDSGYLKPEKLLSWYFGISEEEALEMLPGQEPLRFEG